MRNIIYKNYVIDASSELTPTIRISPFSNTFLSHQLSVEKKPVRSLDFFRNRWSNFKILPKARCGISIALETLGVTQDDVVTILTTSGNFYISGCVTKEIEKYCRWSREITARTKVIFVNHEFGYPFPNLAALREYNLPIIEDCAHAFFSDNGEIGRVGDFVIYSLPKAFPLQMGGVIVFNNTDYQLSTKYDAGLDVYVLSRLEGLLFDIEQIKEKRLFNYSRLKNLLSPLGITPFFSLEEGVIPGAFLFRWMDKIDYPKLKEFMQSNGVESSVFYGENAFFIPCHDKLTEEELKYMVELLHFYFIYGL